MGTRWWSFRDDCNRIDQSRAYFLRSTRSRWAVEESLSRAFCNPRLFFPFLLTLLIPSPAFRRQWLLLFFVAIGVTIPALTNRAESANAAVSPATLDSGGDVGQYASMVLTANGRPVIAYYDNTNDELKVLACNDVDRLVSLTNYPDPNAQNRDLGRFTSIRLDSSGNPVIAYYNATEQKLKIAHCTYSNCALNLGTFNVPDKTASVGQYASMQLDSLTGPS